MKTTTNPQLGLLDSLMPSLAANAFLDQLNQAMDWRPIEDALWAMYPAPTGRPPAQPHYGYKAHVAMDRTHKLVRRASLTGAHVHDSREFEPWVTGEQEMVVADKAYRSQAHNLWCARHRVANGIVKRARRGEKPRLWARVFNQVLSRLRSPVE